MTVEILTGDAEATLRTLPDASCHMCVTSPPFFGLRDYGTGTWEGGDEGCDHDVRRWEGAKQTQGAQSGHASKTDKLGRRTCPCGARRIDQQIGLEASPSEWVERLVAVFREVGRVLRPDGTLWLEVGDSYAGSGPSGAAYQSETTKRRADGDGTDGVFRVSKTLADRGLTYAEKKPVPPPGLKPKDLVGAPWLLAFALRAAGWYLRSDIIWARPNPMPESVRDRPTKAHSYVFLLSRQPRYFFDADAIREPHETAPIRRTPPTDEYAAGIKPSEVAGRPVNRGGRALAYAYPDGVPGNPAGRNARSVWSIPTQPLSEPHYAAFPEELARRCILAGTSERGVCPECGAPWRRVTTETHDAEGRTTNGQKPRTEERRGFDVRMVKSTETVGWEPGCDHDHEPVPATVLDPFLGSGTTALVARKLGRACVGIELSPEYVEIAWRRLRDPDALNRAAHAADGPAQLALTDKEAM